MDPFTIENISVLYRFWWLEILSQSHFIGRLTSNKITRVIPMKEYLVFYEINENRIEIISFWDNRQNFENRKIK